MRYFCNLGGGICPSEVLVVGGNGTSHRQRKLKKMDLWECPYEKSLKALIYVVYI